MGVMGVLGTAPRTLLIAGIHHGEWASAPAAQALVIAEQEFVKAGWRVTTVEVVEQEPFDQVLSPEQLIAHRRAQRDLERRWRKYLHGTTGNKAAVLANARASVGQFLESLALRLNPAYRRRTDRARQIQERVTEKHCQAMRCALERQADWVLLLESDATLRPDSASGLAELAHWLPSTGTWFIDLAGGITGLESIHPTQPIAGTHLVRLLPPVTNTACAYLVSQQLAADLLEYRHANPESGQWAIDWFINAAFMAFMSAHEQATIVECARCQPRILDHGSFTGVTKSWRISA